MGDMQEVPRIITLEEHYADPEVLAYYGMPDDPFSARLAEVSADRLAGMDAAGIGLQVLSHAPPGLQGVDAAAAPGLARRANDRLRQMIARNPTRFAGFASLPTAAPEAAADELERAVTEQGLKGGMIHGLTQGLFLDDRRFWPIFARAEALGVPIYLHPSDPLPVVRTAYFGAYAETHPMFLRAAWGFTIETGTQAMRLVLSGLLDAYPRLQLILGHFGETIPFLLTRIDEALGRDTPMKDFRAKFTKHFHVTTSGFFSDAALQNCIQEIGIDRIMFSVDWPFASQNTGTEWAAQLKLCKMDRAKLMFGNAETLLKLSRTS